MNFRLFGIKFNISLVFALSLSLFLAFDKTKSFLPLFLSITIHELSHLLFLCYFGAKPKEINFDLGTINIKNNTILNRTEEIIVLLSGPLSNLFIFLCSDVIVNENFKNINLCLFIVNMLLIEGLDGGEIFKIILERFFKNKTVKLIMNILKAATIFMLLLLFVFGVYIGVVNYTLLLFSVYILIIDK